MIYTENHIHSEMSPDAFDTMTNMALASYKIGVRYLCFTDHCDLDNHMTAEPDPDCFFFRDEMLAKFEEAKANVPKDMQLFIGLELGEGNHDPEGFDKIASDSELDFILATLHNLRNTKDFYNINYPNKAYCEELLDRYMTELIEIANLPNFDSMAHICYPVRYMRRDGFDVSMDITTHREGLEELFKILIQNGKGIEINCSGLRNKLLGDTIPTRDVLELYRNMGGEIITVGSDSHQAQHVEVGVRQGYEILRDLGFKYVTYFNKRKPLFNKL